MFNPFKWFKKKKQQGCDSTINYELLNLLEEVETTVEEQNKKQCCDGCTQCDSLKKSCSARKLSDEMPKAKQPRLKRIKK